MKQSQIFAYISAFVVMFLVATLPSGSMKSINTAWYKCVRSKITPPNYVFPIVWTILYALIAVCLAETILLDRSRNKTILLWLYAVNLALNVAWTLAYFGWKQPYLAYAILLGLVASALGLLYYSYEMMPLWVVYMLIPYYLWLSFALVLSTVSLNKRCS